MFQLKAAQCPECWWSWAALAGAVTSFPFYFLPFKTCPALHHLSSAGLYAELIPKKALCIQSESISVPLCPRKLFLWLKCAKSPSLEVFQERWMLHWVTGLQQHGLLVGLHDLGGLSSLNESIILWPYFKSSYWTAGLWERQKQRISSYLD